MPGATSGRSRIGAVVWSLAFMLLGYVTMGAVSQVVGIALATSYPSTVTGTTGPLLIQAGVGIAIFGGLSFLIGKRALRLSSDELGWTRARNPLAAVTTFTVQIASLLGIMRSASTTTFRLNMVILLARNGTSRSNSAANSETILCNL